VTRPDVSVIIAAWKAERFLERAVTSATASRHLGVEVIVVDDASPDGTYAVAQRLAAADPRIVADRLSVNGGPSAARNRAIALAKGRFIAVLDADDTIAPDRLSALVGHASATGADIVVDNMTEVDEAGRSLGDARFLSSPTFATDREIDLETWIAFNQPMKRGDCIGYLKPVIRREALPAAGAAYDTALRNSEDYYLVANLLADGKRMAYLATPGYFYTRHSQSTSHRLKAEHTRAWLDAEKRFAETHRGRLSQDAGKAASRRLRALRNVHQLVATIDAVKARRLGNALGVMVSDAQGAMYTLGVFARIALGKALRRKLV
jgi:succinoglycan biosynthesis protein ExoO